MSCSIFKYHAKETRPDVAVGNEAITTRQQQPDIISATAKKYEKQNNK